MLVHLVHKNELSVANLTSQTNWTTSLDLAVYGSQLLLPSNFYYNLISVQLLAQS